MQWQNKSYLILIDCLLYITKLVKFPNFRMNDPYQYQYTYISFYYQGWRSGRFLQLVAFFIEKPSITVIKASRGHFNGGGERSLQRKPARRNWRALGEPRLPPLIFPLVHLQISNVNHRGEEADISRSLQF